MSKPPLSPAADAAIMDWTFEDGALLTDSDPVREGTVAECVEWLIAQDARERTRYTLCAEDEVYPAAEVLAMRARGEV